MASSQYVALLRGINVGGRNKVPMAELRATFEDAGHTDVRTYIQSGNVVFRSRAPRASLEVAVERMLERHLGFPLVVVVRSHAQLRSVVANAPAKFGANPKTFHSDAIFLRAPLTPAPATGAVVDALLAAGASRPGGDRWLSPEIDTAHGLVLDGTVRRAAESETGPLT